MMRLSNLPVTLWSLFCVVAIGCGGTSVDTSGGNGAKPVSCAGQAALPPPSSGSTVTVTFKDGAPSAVATRMGNGPFTTAALQNGTLSISLPPGTTNYAIAYLCSSVFNPFGPGPNQIEFIVEATLSDGPAHSLRCFQGTLSPLIEGSVPFDASAFPGNKGAAVFGINGPAGGASFGDGFTSGTVPYHLPAGSYDLAITIDAAARVFRNQTIPGTINGGQTVVFTADDAMPSESLSVANVAPGLVVLPSLVTFFSANGLNIPLGVLSSNNSNNQGAYQTINPAATQSSDWYRYDAAGLPMVGATETKSDGASCTITLPTPWTYSGPAAAVFPTFAFNYSGFPHVAEYAQIQWFIGPTGGKQPNASIVVIATSNFQNGKTTITIPDLTSLPGFFGPPPTGTSITTIAAIYGGTMPPFTIFPSFFPNRIGPSVTDVPTNNSISFVVSEGGYTQP